MNFIRRRKWMLALGVLLLVVLYYSAYLYLRSHHTFVHRAGYYAFDARLGIERHTNHYIEPASVADGPQIFGLVAVAAAASGTQIDFENPEFKAMLEEAQRQISKKEQDRERLFTLFKPAAFCETVFWKVVNPNPEIPRP